MANMFDQCYDLKDISALSNWDVSNVTNFINMFVVCKNLENASGINNWDISINATFTGMFLNTSTHPEFTRVSGTWDSNGTFTPNA